MASPAASPEGASILAATWITRGKAFVERFDANAYLAILRAMDTWDPLRGYASAQEAFSRIKAHVSFIGISSDWLFPAVEVRQFAEAIRARRRQASTTARWKATTATTRSWPNRRSWCGCCSKLFRMSKSVAPEWAVVPYSCYRGVVRWGSNPKARLVRRENAFYNPPTQLGSRGIVLSVTRQRIAVW